MPSLQPDQGYSCYDEGVNAYRPKRDGKAAPSGPKASEGVPNMSKAGSKDKAALTTANLKPHDSFDYHDYRPHKEAGPENPGSAVHGYIQHGKD